MDGNHAMEPLSYVAAIFILSFVTYSFLRQFDEKSTAELDKVIDLQKHEINPTITWLSARIGLKRAMRLTWIIIATGVATGDAYIATGFPYGVPILALIVGFGHVLAAASNKHVSYLVNKLGVEEFEREHDERMQELARVNFVGKLRLIYKANPTSILMLLVATPLVAALGYAMVATELFTVISVPFKFVVIPLNVAFCFIIATLVIQPAFAIGPLMLSRRYSKRHAAVTADSAPSTVSIQVPVTVVTAALESARKNGELSVRITIPISLSDSGGPKLPPGGEQR